LLNYYLRGKTKVFITPCKLGKAQFGFPPSENTTDLNIFADQLVFKLVVLFQEIEEGTRG
jgi:hypothetical protein